MNSERWQQVDRLLQAALERDPSERSAFLREASVGDEALRKEVESILASDESSFLKSPALEDAAPLLDDGKSNSVLGRRFGSYQIISQLGAGGMGEVYLPMTRDLAVRWRSSCCHHSSPKTSSD